MVAGDSSPIVSTLGLCLVSGPAGSGKSRWAEHLAESSALDVVYLATGPSRPNDPSWQWRVEQHRRRRPTHWRCQEVAGDLTPGLESLEPGQVGLGDSIGTWVAAHLKLDSTAWERRWEELQTSIQRSKVPLIFVCEEVGWGVVPPTTIGMRFRERLSSVQGWLSASAGSAWLVLQGRAIDLIAMSIPVPTEPPGSPPGLLS